MHRRSPLPLAWFALLLAPTLAAGATTVAKSGDASPDYLKWDNNMWVNCDRPGHGHGASDGNFAHVNSLYEILSALRARCPDLLIENVSGGGTGLIGTASGSDLMANGIDIVQSPNTAAHLLILTAK